MVFNPTVNAEIRFDQPVSPGPSGLEAVANIVGNLGVFDTIAQSRQPEAAPSGFNEAVDFFRRETGVEGNVLDWTSNTRREFTNAFPEWGDDLLDVQEQYGMSGEVSARAERDMFNDFLVSDQGQMAQNRAAQLFPDDPGGQSLYIEEQRLHHIQSAENHRLLQIESESADYRGNLSQEAWDLSQGDLRDAANNAAYTLANLAPALRAGQRIPVEDISPQLAQMLPGITEIHQGNLDTVSQVFRASLVTGLRSELQGAYGRQINDPGQEYVENTFAMYDSIVSAVLDDTDPQGSLDRLMAQENLLVMEQLQETGGTTALAVMDLMRDNPGGMNWLLSNAEVYGPGGSLAESMSAILQGGVPSPQDIQDLSASEAATAVEGSMVQLQGLADTPHTQWSEAQRSAVTGVVTLLSGAAERAGITNIDDPVYDVLLNPNVMQGISASPEAREALASLIMADLQEDFDVIAQTFPMNDLSFQNGQLVLAGETNPLIPRQERELLESVNQRLGQMNRAGVPDLLGATVQDIFATQINTLGPQGLLPPSSEPTSTAGSPANPGGFGMMGGAGAGQTLSIPDEDTTVLDEVTNRYSGGNGEFAGGGETIGRRSLNRGGDFNPDFTQNVITSLAHTESRGAPNNGFGAVNYEAGSGGNGHFGRLQFSRGRLDDARRAGVLPQDMTPEEFLNDPQAQMEVEAWHINDYRRRFREDGLIDYVGQTIRGVPVTESGLIAAAHLGGYAGLTRFLESGGSSDPSDAYGTSLMEYFSEHGGLTGDGQPIQLSAPSNGSQVMENVWATNGMTPLIGSMEGASNMTQPYAAERMDELLQGPFQRLQQLYGGSVTINDAIARAGTSRENQTPGSRHFHGDAIDADISGMSDEERLRLVRAAHAAGFQGFGFGNGILHIDMGSARSWAYGNDTYGGMPLADVQAMVSSGNFGGNFPTIGADGVPLRPEQRNVETLQGLRDNSLPDFGDEGEGAPTNFTTYDPVDMSATTVEQQPTGAGVVTPEQSSTGPATGSKDTTTETVDPEISEMIEALTQRSDFDNNQLREILARLLERENDE